MFRVMIVDDEPIIRKGISCLIDWCALDCEVVFQAANGKEACTFLATAEVDVIVSDVKMPVMDGIALARAILAEHPSIRVILLSAFADFDLAQAAIQANVVDYVIKTRYVEKLPEAVRKACDMVVQQRVVEEELQLLQHAREADRKERCAALLRDAMNGLLANPEEMRTKIEACGIVLREYRVMVFEICVEPEGPDEPTVEDNNQFSRSIQNFLALALKEYAHFTLFMEKNLLASIITGSEDLAVPSLQALLVSGNEILSVIDGFSQHTMGIGISDTHHHSEELPIAWQEASEALTGVFYNGSRVSVFLGRAEERPSGPNPAYKLVDDIVEAVHQGQLEAAIAGLAKLLEAHRLHQSPIEQVKTTALLLCSTCFRLLSRALSEGGATEEEEAILYDKIRMSKTLKRLSSVLQAQIEKTAKLLRAQRKQEHPLVREIGQFIRTHYNKPLSLRVMAEHVHMNSSYLSSLYKKQTGEALNDALNRYRIDVAKKLLRETGRKVQDVAQAVGIGDPAYFTHVFTRYAGVSPSEYRVKQPLDD